MTTFGEEGVQGEKDKVRKRQKRKREENRKINKEQKKTQKFLSLHDPTGSDLGLDRIGFTQSKPFLRYNNIKYQKKIFNNLKKIRNFQKMEKK